MKKVITYGAVSYTHLDVYKRQLLILAGLTITMLTGENGILTQTRLAQKKTKISSEKEAIEMAICEVQMSNQKEATINLDEIKKSIQKYLDTDNITITNNEKGIANVLVEDSKRVYYIDSNYSVTEYGEFDYLIKNIYDLDVYKRQKYLMTKKKRPMRKT